MKWGPTRCLRIKQKTKNDAKKGGPRRDPKSNQKRALRNSGVKMCRFSRALEENSYFYYFFKGINNLTNLELETCWRLDLDLWGGMDDGLAECACRAEDLELDIPGFWFGTLCPAEGGLLDSRAVHSARPIGQSLRTRGAAFVGATACPLQIPTCWWHSCICVCSRACMCAGVLVCLCACWHFGVFVCLGI